MIVPTPPPSAQSSQSRRVLHGTGEYVGKLRLFQRNARLYLLLTVVTGIAFGVFRVVFNFYVLGLGYDKVLLGRVLTVSSLAALAMALPAGLLGDRIGRKYSLLLSTVVQSAAVAGMVAWPTATGFYVTSLLLGVAQSLAAVTLGPFLMENSSDRERTYLFSFASGIQMVAAFASNWLGGWLPGRLAAAGGAPAASALAYGLSLSVVAAIGALGIVPVLLLRRRRLARPADHVDLSPLDYARRHPADLARLTLPMVVTSLGAGLFMPFMNVFYREVHGSSDEVIGKLFAMGSLAMAAGLLIAPPLADRYGKVRFVVVTQAVSVPFLLVLGYSPIFGVSAVAYLVRLALMNMSNPVYQAFVMEEVAEESRATVASLVSLAWSFGWAFSPTVSGALQVRYGFGPVFACVVVLYCLAISLYWRFFLRRPRASR